MNKIVLNEGPILKTVGSFSRKVAKKLKPERIINAIRALRTLIKPEPSRAAKVASTIGKGALWTTGMFGGGALVQKAMTPVEKKYMDKADQKLLDKGILPSKSKEEAVLPSLVKAGKTAGKILGSTAVMSVGFGASDTAGRIKDYEKNQKIAYDRLVSTGQIDPDLLKNKLKHIKSKTVKESAPEKAVGSARNLIKTGLIFTGANIIGGAATDLIRDKLKDKAEKELDKKVAQMKIRYDLRKEAEKKELNKTESVKEKLAFLKDKTVKAVGDDIKGDAIYYGKKAGQGAGALAILYAAHKLAKKVKK